MAQAAPKDVGSTDVVDSLSTDPVNPAVGDDIEDVTGTGGRPAIIADATTGHGTVPVQTRNERFASADVADYPAVTGREAVWKLNHVNDLKHLIEGDLGGGR